MHEVAKHLLTPSKRSDVPPFMVMDVMAAAAALEAKGAHILHMEVGQPAAPAPATAIAAARAALAHGRIEGLFGDQIIVDQTWASDAIYTVFHRQADFQGEFRVRHGRFTRELLDRFVWGSGPTGPRSDAVHPGRAGTVPRPDGAVPHRLQDPKTYGRQVEYGVGVRCSGAAAGVDGSTRRPSSVIYCGNARTPR